MSIGYELGSILAGGTNRNDSYASGLTSPGSTNTYFTVSDYAIKSLLTYMKVESQTLGDAFVLSHATLGVLGTNVLNSSTQSSFSTYHEQDNLTTNLTTYGLENMAGWIAQETGAEGPSRMQIGSFPSRGIMLAWTDNTAAWAATGQAGSLAVSSTTTVGSQSISHDKTSGGTSATITSTVIDNANISSMRYVLFTHYRPSVSGGSIASVALQLSDGTNTSTYTASGSAGWNHVVIDLDAPSSTSGTLNLEDVESVAVIVTTDVSGATYSGFLVAPLFSYNESSVIPTGSVVMPHIIPAIDDTYGAYTSTADFDDQFNYLVLDLPLHASNATDRSGNGNNGTITAATSARGPSDQDAEALSFVDTSTYVAVADHATLKPAAIVISAWVKPQNITSTMRIVNKGYTGNGAWVLQIVNDAVQFIVTNSGGTAYTASYASAVVADRWYHVLGWFDGTTVKVYVNNIVGSTTATVSGTGFLQNTSSIEISDTATNPFYGIISQVKMYSKALSDEERVTIAEENPFKRITHTSYIIPYQTTYAQEIGLKSTSWWKKRWNRSTLALWDTGTGTDSSYYAHNLTLSGATASAEDPYYDTRAISFDGTNDSASSNSADHNTNSALTVMAWIYRNYTGTDRTIINKGSTSGTQFIELTTADATPSNLGISIGSTLTNNSFTCEGILPYQTWVHIAVVIDNSQKVCTVYKNGFFYESFTLDTGTSNLSSTSTVYLGARQGSSRYFGGRLFQVIWANRVFTEEDIKNVLWGDLFVWKTINGLSMSSTSRYRVTFEITTQNVSVGRGRVTKDGIIATRNYLGNTIGTSPRYSEWNDSSALVSVYNNYSNWDVGTANEDRNAWSTSFLRDRNQVTYDAILLRSEMNSTNIRKTGIFNASSGATLFAESKFGAIAKENTFQISESGRVRFL